MAAPADGCGRPSAHGGRAQVALAFTTRAANSWQAAQSGLRIRVIAGRVVTGTPRKFPARPMIESRANVS